MKLENQQNISENHERDLHSRFAIVREIPDSYTDYAITQYYVGDRPNLDLTRRQHFAYAELLDQLGFTIIRLPAEERYPDCPFVEDPFVIGQKIALKTIPGAESRRGEGEAIEAVLQQQGKTITEMQPPATLDGGDVLKIVDEKGNISKIYIGLSKRTNQAGINQLRDAFVLFDNLSPENIVGIPVLENCLHLKTAATYIGDNIMLVDPLGIDPVNFQGDSFKIILIDSDEKYASNCIRATKNILVMPSGFPNTRTKIEYAFKDVRQKITIMELTMTEFEKTDGGLTCLSLMFT